MRRDLSGDLIAYKCRSDAKEAKRVFTNDWDYQIKVLEEYIASASGEQHDAIVYASGCEFNPSNPDAVKFISERLQKSIGITHTEYRFDSDSNINGVIPATTPEEYVAYRHSGGQPDEYIEDSIRKRAKRERRSKQERGVLYVPSVATLSKHLDKLYTRQIYFDVDPYNSNFSFYEDFFLNTFSNFACKRPILTILLIAIAMFSFAFIFVFLSVFGGNGYLKLPFGIIYGR